MKTEKLVEDLLEQEESDAVHKAAMLKGTVYELLSFLTKVTEAAQDCYDAASEFPEKVRKTGFTKWPASEMTGMLRQVNAAHHSATDIMTTLDDVRRNMK